MKFIIGLGNPGKEYEGTRHNAGFEVVDALARELDASWKNDRTHQALVCKTNIGDRAVVLVKPQTFMNRSGYAVLSILSYYKGMVSDVLVIHDEMDLEPGRIAFIANGGNAGHNGVASIQERFATREVARLRIGIGRPTPPLPKEDWVLHRATGEDAKATEAAIKKATEAVSDWVAHGNNKAMNRWN